MKTMRRVIAELKADYHACIHDHIIIQKHDWVGGYFQCATDKRTWTYQ